MPYSDNIEPLPYTIPPIMHTDVENEAIRALETAFANLGVEIDNEKTRTAVAIIATAIVNAIVFERTVTDHRLEVLISNQHNIRTDIQAILNALTDHRDYVSTRVHTIANHVMGVELKIDELAELVTMHFDIQSHTGNLRIHDSNTTDTSGYNIE